MIRLRITFAKGEEVRYISHLDLMRAWERLLRRANVPLAYSKGFNPHPKMSFATPLPVGVTGTAELMDVVLETTMTPDEFRVMIEGQRLPGVEVIAVDEVDLAAPSLPSLVRAGEYRARLAGDERREVIAGRIDGLLAARELIRDRRREGEVRRYDLRPLVDDISIEDWDGEKVLWMRLNVASTGTGRPDEVLDALGLGESVIGVDRTRIVVGLR